jgi:hypothetical protein
VTASSFFGIDWEQAAFASTWSTASLGIKNDVYFKFAPGAAHGPSWRPVAIHARLQIARSLEIQESEDWDPPPPPSPRPA